MHGDQIQMLFISWKHRGKNCVAAVADKGWDVQSFHSTWQKKCCCDSLHTSVRPNTANPVALLPLKQEAEHKMPQSPSQS